MSNKTAIIIDSMVNDQETITKSIMDSVTVCKIGDDVLALNGVTRLGYMFHNEFECKIPDIQLKKTNVNKSEYKFYPQNLVQLLTKLGSGVTLDIISCNMNSTDFVNETLLLSAKLGIKIQYSVNQTGNGVDADWTLESNNENLVGIYFTSNILTWKFNLATANTIVYDNSYDILLYFNNASAGSLSYHNNKYKLNHDIPELDNYIDSYQVHIQLNNKQVFDGNNHTITLTGATSGLFVFDSTSLETTVKNLTILGPTISRNGSAFVKYRQSFFTIDNCTNNINNILLNAPLIGGIVGYYCSKFLVKNSTNNSIIPNYSGGICSVLCNNFKIINCKNNIIALNQQIDPQSDPYINLSGGIVGENSSKFKVISCTNYRPLLLGFSGGIVAKNCYDFKIIKCKNYGTLNGKNIEGGGNNGGIIAQGCYNFNVYKCINYGAINGDNSSGIIYESSSNFICSQCTNKGIISGNNCSGIVGGNYISNSLYVKLYKCVNIGNITENNSGGIVGSGFGAFLFGRQNGKLELIKCKNYGTVLKDNNNGGICGPNLGNVDYANNGSYNTIVLKKMLD